MIEWIIAHTHYFLLLVIIASLKQEIKKGFLQRSTIVANTASILAASGAYWFSLSWFIQIWILVGIPVGIIAFISYMTDFSMPAPFYYVTFGLYNSLFAILFILSLG